jgi:glucoamylase
MAYPSATTGTYQNQNSTDFNNLLNGVLAYADDYVNVFFKYLPADGSLAEQYSRENGTPVSARDLTWSYASFVTMRAARLSATTNHTKVPSWGASTANTPPSVCIASSAPGTYTPAVGAGAPPASGGCTILVTFNVNASTFYGENIYLSGDSAEFGNWSPADAVPGNAGGYTSERPLWSFDVDMAANSTVSYGYLRNEPDGMWLYETRNRTLSVPACGEKGDLTVEDAWVGPVGTPPLTAA